ncbi:free fatty acid receptor 3 [Cololabis saira]|uniref:free fatty acid receptor 3 n=1 Tax=Cololabis saira TaxID=129043 RepID=UPI002AD571D2|nr:free fatty acid receptor 3 [Cololabis saira]
MELSGVDYVALTVYCFTFLLGFPANLLVLLVYVRKARRHGATPNVVYALNLCLANLALVAWLPIKALEMGLQDWRLPPLVCPIYSFFLYASVYGSCLFLTAVTVGRYLSIAFPIVYKRYRRARLSCYVCVGLWVLVMAHLSISLATEGGAHFVGVKDDASVCYDHFNASQLRVLLPLRLEMSVVLFLLPLAITSFCTLRCVALVWRSNLRPMGKRRVLAVALSTLAVFVVCYAPYNASHIVGFVQAKNVEWRSYAMLTSTCNVFLEPVVMLMLSPAVSRGILGKVCGRQSHFRRSDASRGKLSNAPSERSRKGEGGGPGDGPGSGLGFGPGSGLGARPWSGLGAGPEADSGSGPGSSPGSGLGSGPEADSGSGPGSSPGSGPRASPDSGPEV